MSQPATVSIITPCYNGARFLGTTLRSALSQSLPPLEIIVVDDGSTDESAAIADAFGSPVRVIRQPNQGESVARNRALSEARGSHVLFLDADDLLKPESLAHLTSAIGDDQNAVAIQGCAWFSEDPEAPYQTRVPDNRTFYPDIIESNFAPPHCWLAPVATVRSAGGFCETMRWFEDWDLWWRVGLTGATLVSVPYVGALYRRHPQSQLATTNRADQARGHAVLMSRMAEALLERRDMLDRHGHRLFWSAVTALERARAAGVSWDELGPLTQALEDLSSKGPSSVVSLRLSRAIRWLGVRMAFRLRGAPRATRRA